MPTVYFDSSALFHLLVPGQGTDVARELWELPGLAVSSVLAHTEVVAAIAAARRSQRVSVSGARRAHAMWAELWAGVAGVGLTPEVSSIAAGLAQRHPLSGADAVHLASALVLGPDPIVASFDRRLHAAARAESLAVAPAAIG